jgi:molybdenum cofactor cytidylyltransferase
VRHAAIVLAAGASRRLGTPKQLLEIDGEPLVRRAARLALGTGADPVVVVVGARSADVRAAVAGLGVLVVECAGWEDGMSAGLAAGIGACGAAHGALVLLTDQHQLSEYHLTLITAAWRRDPSRAVASGYAGTRGVPAMLPRSWWGDVAAVRGDEGARSLLRSREDVVVIDAPGLAADLDRPGDLP